MVYLFQDFKISEQAKTPHYLVIGHPISHSLSPLMHGIALDHHKINAGYFAVDLPAEQIPDFASWCNRDEFLGCNITLPYKREFVELTDRLDPVAEEMGVINTIVKEDFKLTGYNTDAYGFLNPLKPYSNHLEQGRAIIFGTGGASRAVAYALLQLGAEELVFVSRNPEKKKRSDDSFAQSQFVDYNQWQEYAGDASLFVNTTPVGMAPGIKETFIRERERYLLEGKICYDLIYNPLQTEFLRQAEMAGAICLSGLDMLIHQGSKSFELWTGKTFPVPEVKQALQNYFKEVL